MRLAFVVRLACALTSASTCVPGVAAAQILQLSSVAECSWIFLGRVDDPGAKCPSLDTRQDSRAAIVIDLGDNAPESIAALTLRVMVVNPTSATFGGIMEVVPLSDPIAVDPFVTTTINPEPNHPILGANPCYSAPATCPARKVANPDQEDGSYLFTFRPGYPWQTADVSGALAALPAGTRYLQLTFIPQGEGTQFAFAGFGGVGSNFPDPQLELLLLPEPPESHLQIETSELTPCEDGFLCAHVVALLSGTAAFGEQHFAIPMPQPGVEWAPRLGSALFAGVMGIGGAYKTEDYFTRPGGIMGSFLEILRFHDESGSEFFSAAAQQAMLCHPSLPPDYPYAAVVCGDANGGVRYREFALGQLAWTRAPVAVSVSLSSSEPLPLPGTEQFRLNDQMIELVVKYSLDANDDGVPNTSDNCPSTANADQLDRGGIGTAEPDGIGDACQCGDVTGDGRVTLSDAAQMRRALLVPPTASMTKPELCDVGGSDACSTGDAAIVQRALLQPSTASLAMHCEASGP